MTDDARDRLGAAAGLVSVLLGLVAVAVGAGGGGGGSANPGAAPEAIARAYAAAPSPAVWVGAFLQVVASLLLFVFVARVWATLRRAEAGSGWLAATALGAGLASVTLTLAGFAVGAAARARGGPGLDVSAVVALFGAHVGLYVASWALGAVFLGATAVLALAAHALPRWLGWAAALGALLTLGAVAAPTTPLAQAPTLLLLLWVLAASVVLLRRPATGPRPQAARAAVAAAP
jgi:hypothetical protein